MPVGEASSDDRLYGDGKLFDLQFAAANPIIPPTALAKWFMRLEPPHLPPPIERQLGLTYALSRIVTTPVTASSGI